MDKRREGCSQETSQRSLSTWDITWEKRNSGMQEEGGGDFGNQELVKDQGLLQECHLEENLSISFDRLNLFIFNYDNILIFNSFRCSRFCV